MSRPARNSDPTPAPGTAPGAAQTELLIGGIFRIAARSAPNRVAVASGDDSLTFGDIDRSANRIGRELRDLGVAFGGRVAAIGSRSVHLVPLFAATAKLGAIYAPIDPLLDPDTVLELLHVADASLVVIDDAQPTASRELAAELGVPAIALSGLVRSSAGNDDSELPVAGPRELDPQVLFFPVRGTGRAKGAVLSHRVHYLRTQLGPLTARGADAVCSHPLSHPSAWELALRRWQTRGRVVLADPKDPACVCEAVRVHGATNLTATPSILRDLLAVVESDDEKALQLRSLREIDICCAAAPEELIEAFSTLLPEAQLRLVYGGAEAGEIAGTEVSELAGHTGSCGTPSPFGELIIDRTGEICVRGPLLFDGYFADEEATRAAVVDGWFHTGDVGELDAQGHLTVLGAARDIIRTKGGAVAPIEVETAIASHVGVADVAVLGLHDKEFGQIVCAVVVPAPGHSPPMLADLRSFCEDRIDWFKLPRRLILVDAIPRSAASKQVKRPLLREQLG